MKKVMCFVLVALSLTSCATVFGGKVSAYQRTKPAPGQPSRPVRAAALIVDVCFGVVPVFVDFATGAIYKPEPKK
jgi:hypothetical protein